MPLNLTTPIANSNTIDSVRINSFAADLDKKELHVVYSEMSGLTVINERVMTIVEPDFTVAITNASTLAGADVYGALKASLYEQIGLAQPGMTGAVI